LDKSAASLLVLDLREQWRVIEEVYARVEDRARSGPGPASVEALAYQLHNLYGAFEQLFELIARAFENQIDNRSYHVDLLRRMRMEVQGVRPRLISSELERDLNELRAFRHFFRHAYGVELKSEPVRAMVEVASRVRAPLEAALDRFAREIAGEA
jgi:hypothetical protein